MPVLTLSWPRSNARRFTGLNSWHSRPVHQLVDFTAAMHQESMWASIGVLLLLHVFSAAWCMHFRSDLIYLDNILLHSMSLLRKKNGWSCGQLFRSGWAVPINRVWPHAWPIARGHMAANCHPASKRLWGPERCPWTTKQTLTFHPESPTFKSLQNWVINRLRLAFEWYIWERWLLKGPPSGDRCKSTWSKMRGEVVRVFHWIVSMIVNEWPLELNAKWWKCAVSKV